MENVGKSYVRKPDDSSPEKRSVEPPGKGRAYRPAVVHGAPDGAWIKAWRARMGYTQELLADELLVTRQTVLVWEKLAKIDRTLHLALQALEMSPELSVYGARHIRTSRGPPGFGSTS